MATISASLRVIGLTDLRRLRLRIRYDPCQNTEMLVPIVSESVCRRQALISWVTRRTRRRERIEMKAISMKAVRCSSVRSKMVCVLQTYMGKEFNVNGQTV